MASRIASLRVLARQSAAAAAAPAVLVLAATGSFFDCTEPTVQPSTAQCEQQPASKSVESKGRSSTIVGVQNTDLRDKIAGALGSPLHRTRKESWPPEKNPGTPDPPASDANTSLPPPATDDDELSPEEARVVATFNRVAPSVAYIQTTALVQHYGMSRQRPFSLQESEVPAGTGSGFLYDSHGHVITNFHVIASGMADMGGKVKVKCHNMAEARDATIVGIDPDRDLAVLKISCEGEDDTLPPPLEMGDSANLRVGQTVLAIGNPFGLDTTLTTGVVSALGRDVMGAGGRPIRGCIQMDAAINPGSSGGPLVDSCGRLIGINMAMISPGMGGGNVGIGFAIPALTVKRIVNQIIKHGRVVRPTLGVNVADDRIVQSIGAQLGVELEGVLVAEVLPGGPADLAGVMSTKLYWDGTVDLGDLLTEVDGVKVTCVEDLLEAIEKYKDGDEVSIKVLKGCDPKQAKKLKAKLTTEDNRGRYANRGGGYRGRTSMVSRRGSY